MEHCYIAPDYAAEARLFQVTVYIIKREKTMHLIRSSLVLICHTLYCMKAVIDSKPPLLFKITKGLSGLSRTYVS